MNENEKDKSIRKWEEFAARCQTGKAERAKIKERHAARFPQQKEAK
jgi:hypothetical protein